MGLGGVYEVCMGADWLRFFFYWLEVLWNLCVVWTGYDVGRNLVCSGVVAVSRWFLLL